LLPKAQWLALWVNSKTLKKRNKKQHAMAQQLNRGTIPKPVGIGFPARMKINRLKLSLNRSFINTIVPEIRPTAAQEATWRTYLGITSSVVDYVECVYCGQRATQLDHFRSLIEKSSGTERGRPTGWITDIFNLVPCCSTCNSSKAGQNWHSWMNGSAKKSPKRLFSAEKLAERVAVLEGFEAWSTPLATRLDVLAIVGKGEWKDYEDEMAAVDKLLQAARLRSDQFHTRLQQAYSEIQARAVTLGATTPPKPAL
jgi:hypothetical protein